jgi:hypothetical protein
MNGRERIALAMENKKPDRVPVMCQLSLGHYFLNCDIPPHKIWFTSEGFTEALLTLRERYQFDGVLINLPGRPEDCLKQITSLEQTKDGEYATWSSGDNIFFPRDDNPHYLNKNNSVQLHPAFETFELQDLDKICDFPGYTWGIYHIPELPHRESNGLLTDVPNYFFRTLDLVREKSNGQFSIHGEVFSPFTHFMELFGYQEALLGLTTDKTKSRAMLDAFTESVIIWAVAQVEQGVDAVLISSAFAGGPFLSRKMYAEFVLPYEKKVVQAVKQAGGVVYTHTCGRIGDRLDLMEETGTMGIDTLDPPPLGNVDLSKAKEQIGQRMFIKGNMNSVDILEFTTEDQVREHAAGRIRIGKPGGGYILSTACSVAPKVEPWKLEMLVPLAEEIGRYEN